MKTEQTTGSRRACDRDGKAPTRLSVWKVVGGAVLLAAMLFGLMAAPGLLFDRDSTAPLHPMREARQ